jgi:hypothetical protein
LLAACKNNTAVKGITTKNKLQEEEEGLTTT